MQKLLAFLMALMLLCGLALAEEPAFAPLPIDVTTIPAAAPAENYTESGYEDASLSVSLEKVALDGVTYNVARVKIAHPSQLRTGLAHEKAKRNNYVSAIAKKYNAVIALSADFFADDKYGYVVRMGEVFRKKPTDQRDMLVIDGHGDFHLLIQSDAAQLQALMQSEAGIVNAFNFGPALVVNGTVQETPNYYKNKYNVYRPEPRCAIGQIGPLEYLLVVADGRNDSKGCTVATMAQFMADQGCLQAYNLDGGDSAQMWFNGEYYSRVTNRTLSDIIYFCTLDEAATEE